MNKKFITLWLFIFLLFFILCPQASTHTVKNTLQLWYEQVLPALLPTLILVKMLLSSHLEIKNPTLFSIISGVALGFPLGVLVTCELTKKKLLPKDNALLYAGLFSQFSPAFIVSYIALECMHTSPITVLLLLYTGPCILFFLFGMFYKRAHGLEITAIHKNETFPTAMNYKVVDASILSSCEALIRICGYMVLCNLFNTFLFEISNNQLLYATAAPVLEVTGGVSILSNSILPYALKQSLLLASVSFGGLSGIFQVSNLLKEADLSLKSYIGIKILCFFTTGIITYIYYTIIL